MSVNCDLCQAKGAKLCMTAIDTRPGPRFWSDEEENEANYTEHLCERHLAEWVAAVADARNKFHGRHKVAHCD